MRFNVVLEWKQGAGNTNKRPAVSSQKRAELVPFSYGVSSYGVEIAYFVLS